MPLFHCSCAKFSRYSQGSALPNDTLRAPNTWRRNINCPIGNAILETTAVTSGHLRTSHSSPNTPTTSDSTKWLDFEVCSYGECTDCAAILGPHCPCRTYVSHTCMQARPFFIYENIMCEFVACRLKSHFAIADIQTSMTTSTMTS